MKSILTSVSAILISLGLVILSSAYVSRTLGDFESRAEAAQIVEGRVTDSVAVFSDMREEYTKKLPILLLLLPDSSLYEIDACFTDVINYALADDYAGALTAKGRLHSAIERMRVLTEFSAKSIF